MNRPCLGMPLLFEQRQRDECGGAAAHLLEARE